MDDKRKVIFKIQKLLKLADTDRNSNLEEAASAAAKAQALMEKHRIKKAMLKQVGTIAWRPLEDNGKPDEWKLFLISQLTKLNGCYAVRSETYEQDNIVNIVGEEQDHETVQEIYTYLVNELNHLCFAELLQFFDKNNQYPDADYTKSWYLGAITTITAKLETAKLRARNQALNEAWTLEQRDEVSNALVIIDDKVKEAKDWVSKHLDAEIRKEKVDQGDIRGYTAGKVAGDKININPDQKALE